MAGRKHRPARASNKDDTGATTGRPGSARDDSQRAGHADHGEPPAVPGVAPLAPPAHAEPPPTNRQPQRPGQDARVEERPGGRDHVTGDSVPTPPKKR